MKPNPSEKLKAIVDRVETAFKLLHGSERVPFVLGRLKWNEHKLTPAIGWLETGGLFSKPRERGVADEDSDTEREPLGSVAVRKRRVEIHIWAKDEDASSALLDELFTATKDTNGDVEIVSYDYQPEYFKQNGMAIVAQCDVGTPVPADTVNSVVVKPMRSYEVSATARGTTTEWEFDPNA